MNLAEHKEQAHRRSVPFAVAHGYKDAIKEIERLRDAIERAISNLDDNHARRVLKRALAGTR